MSDIVVGLKLRADSSGFVGEVRVSAAELDKLRPAAERAGRGMGALGRGADIARSQIQRLTSAGRSLMSHVMSLRGLVAGVGAGVLAKSFIDAASAMEQYQNRLTILLRSQEEGARLFGEMNDYARQTPFEFNEVMQAATQLSGVMKGGVDEITQWMPMIGDLAATAGLSIGQTTEQVIRMYSAGAASADMFRERGVLAMLGFQAGVSYTAEETRERMMAAWTRADSQFRGATDALATTWDGTMGKLGDQWFAFRTQIMEAGLFDYLKSLVTVVNDDLGGAIDSNDEAAQRWARHAVDGIEATIRATGTLITYTGRAISAVEDHPEIAQYGLIGFLIWGRKGALIGGLIGGAFEAIRSELRTLGVGIEEGPGAELESLRMRIEAARKQITTLAGSDNPARQQMIGPMQDALAQMAWQELELQEQLKVSGGWDAWAERMRTANDETTGFGETLRRLGEHLSGSVLDRARAGMGGSPGGAPAGGSGGGGGGDLTSPWDAGEIQAQFERLQESLLSEEEALGLSYQRRAEIVGQALATRVVSEEQALATLGQLEADYQKQRAGLQMKTERDIASVREGAVRNAVGLLNTLAGESKVAAVASIAITKGLAMAQTWAHTQTASMLAYASQLVPGDPSSPARAEAARAYTLGIGKLSMGLIAATGLVEAAQAMGGGGGGGGGSGGASPVFSADPLTGIPTDSGSQRQERTVQVVFQDSAFYGYDDYATEQIMQRIETAVREADRVFISRGSRQAQELGVG